MASSEDKDRHDRLLKTLLRGFSAEELERQRRGEYRLKYPKATEAEIQLLMDADDKAGYPPQGLGHAKYIMRTKAGARLPAPTAKDFDDAALAVMRFRRGYSAPVANMRFCDWDDRPAVMVGREAFAVLRPGWPWVSVDRDDVRETAGVMSEFAWRSKFEGKFGPLDVSNIPDHSADKSLRPRLSEKDFDEALAAARRDHKPLVSRMIFTNWDRRPAVLIDNKAFAVLAPGEDWVRVSRHDVFGTASVMSEAKWRKAFSDFTPLDLAKIPDHSGDKPA
jgi:hypothetical protein